MVKHYLEFEKPLIELEREIDNLKRFSKGRPFQFNEQLKDFERETPLFLRTIKKFRRKTSSFTKGNIFHSNGLANYPVGKAYRSP
jgi:hypothetical protein